MVFGLIRITSLNGKTYDLKIIDDFSQYAWILFLAHKDKDFKVFSNIFEKMINKYGLSILKVRNGYGTKF